MPAAGWAESVHLLVHPFYGNERKIWQQRVPMNVQRLPLGPFVEQQSSPRLSQRAGRIKDCPQGTGFSGDSQENLMYSSLASSGHESLKV